MQGLTLSVLVFVIAVAGCSTTDGATGTAAEGTACSAAETCASGSCLTFKPNKQKLPGICVRKCSGDAECGAGGICLSVGADLVCAKGCSQTADCKNGLVCLPSLEAKQGPGVCLAVEASEKGNALGEACDPKKDDECLSPARCDAVTKTCIYKKCKTSDECGAYDCLPVIMACALNCFVGGTGNVTACAAGNACRTATAQCSPACDPASPDDRLCRGTSCDPATMTCK
jgi:hypothetical protein